jgi:hypothetical protein
MHIHLWVGPRDIGDPHFVLCVRRLTLQFEERPIYACVAAKHGFHLAIRVKTRHHHSRSDAVETLRAVAHDVDIPAMLS